MHIAVSRVFDIVELVDNVLGPAPFPCGYVHMSSSFRRPPSGPIYFDGKFCAVTFVDALDIQAYQEWIKGVATLRSVNRRLLEKLSPRFFHTLWLDHPWQIRILTDSVSSDYLKLVRHIRLDIPWLHGSLHDVWEIDETCDAVEGWNDWITDREDRYAIGRPNSEADFLNIPVERQTSSLYGKLLEALPNLISFDNGFTGLGVSQSFLPEGPLKQILHPLPESIQTLKLVLWPNSSTLLELLPQLPNLNNLSLEFVEMVPVYAKAPPALQDSVFSQVQSLSITARECHFLVCCIFTHWKLPKLCTVAMRVLGLVKEELIRGFLSQNGSHIHTLELACAWFPADISDLCPALTSLTVDWVGGIPESTHGSLEVGCFSTIKKLCLYNSGACCLQDLLNPRVWKPLQMLEAILSHPNSWTNLQEIWDFDIYRNRDPSHALDGFFHWRESYAERFKERGVLCLDEFGSLLLDIDMDEVEHFVLDKYTCTFFPSLSLFDV